MRNDFAAMVFFLYFLMLGALAAPPPTNLTTILTTLTKHPAGHLRLTQTTLFSLTPANLTLDSHNLTAAQASALTALLLTYGPDQHSGSAPSSSLTATILPLSTAIIPPPDSLLGPCSPPLACRNSTTCGTACGFCTYLGFFPYGLCLSG